MNVRKAHFRTPDLIGLVLCITLLAVCFGAAGESGHRRAKEMVCLANLRQWNGVFRDYLEENDGKFFTGQTPSGYWWPVQLDDTTQSWRKNKTWFCPTATQPLVDETGRSSQHTTSLVAWGIFKTSQLGPDGIAGSYGLNGYTIDIPATSVYEGGVPSDGGWHDLLNVPRAETIPLFFDALRFDLWPLHTDAPADHPNAAWSGRQMARCCIDRHGGAVNCLFLDGSARKVGLKELWTLKWHREYNTAGPWTRAGGALASDWPEWMRGFKDY